MSEGNTPAVKFELLTLGDRNALLHEASALRGEYAVALARKLGTRLARAIPGRHATPSGTPA